MIDDMIDDMMMDMIDIVFKNRLSLNWKEFVQHIKKVVESEL